MMTIPKPGDAEDDLRRMMYEVRGRRTGLDLSVDAMLELAGEMSQPADVSSPSKAQHHCVND